MIKGELHILPTDVTPTCPIFTGKTGPLDGPTRRKRLSNPGRTDLLEVSGDTTCLKGFNNNPEYTNTQQGLPDLGYT